jgi:DNA-binding beta-propeller fold protein YncE
VKRISAVIFVLLLLLSAVIAQNSKLYKQVAKFDVGGDGGWDYITFDPSSNRLFIGHSTEITVVDAENGKKTGSIPAKGAHGVAIVADKNLGFSSNGRAGTVTVFDLKTLQPKQDIKAGENPDAIIYDRYSKKVLVMNGRSKDMMVIDPDSLKIVQTIPLGGKLEFAATDPGHAYVNVEDTGEIASVNTKTWKAEKRWKLAGCEEPSGLAIDEKTHHLFSVCGNSKMMIVDTNDGHIISTVPTGDGTDGAAFDPELGCAFASNGADATLTVVNRGSDGKYQVAGNITTQKGARTVAVDPKSHRVFLPTAELGPPAEGQRRPSIKPGTFVVLVYAPAQ